MKLSKENENEFKAIEITFLQGNKLIISEGHELIHENNIKEIDDINYQLIKTYTFLQDGEPEIHYYNKKHIIELYIHS